MQSKRKKYAKDSRILAFYNRIANTNATKEIESLFSFNFDRDYSYPSPSPSRNIPKAHLICMRETPRARILINKLKSTEKFAIRVTCELE